jgi:hypothetical protein
MVAIRPATHRSPRTFLNEAASASVGLHGRDAEIAWLEARVRPGAVVAVTGPGGIGKSALVDRWEMRLGGASVMRFVPVTGALDELETAMAGWPTSGELVVRIDDAHRLSAEAVAQLVASLRRTPQPAVVLTARHAAVPATDLLELGPVDMPAATAIFVGALPPDALAAATAYAECGVIERCGGWPLALRLAAASARVWTPAMLAEVAATRLYGFEGPSLGLAEVPPLVDALVFAFGRLSAPEAALLRVLAHLDRPVDLALLRHAIQATPAALGMDAADAMRRLSRDGWIVGHPSMSGMCLMPPARAWLVSERADPEAVETRATADALARRLYLADKGARLAAELVAAGDLREHGELAAARVAVRRVAAEVGRDAEALPELVREAAVAEVRVLLDEGQTVLADAAQRRVAASWADHPDTIGLAAMAALGRGAHEEALALARRAVAGQPAGLDWHVVAGLAALALADAVATDDVQRGLVEIAMNSNDPVVERRAWAFVAVAWALTGRDGVALALEEVDRLEARDLPETALWLRFARALADHGERGRCRALEAAAQVLRGMVAPTVGARCFRALALGWLERGMHETQQRQRFEIAADGSWFRGADAVQVDLGRKPVLRLLLLALARRRKADPASPCSAVPIDQDVLIGQVWPGERILARAARSRLHVAVCALRKLGFHDALARRGTGYALDAEVVWNDAV